MLHAEARFADALDDAVIVPLAGSDPFRVNFAIARRHGVIGGTLEHGELLGLLRNFRNRLDGAGAGADDGDPLAGEVYTAFRETGLYGTICPGISPGL